MALSNSITIIASAMKFLLFAAFAPSTLACTSFMIGPDATADGVPIVAQSDDGEGAGDPRLVKGCAIL